MTKLPADKAGWSLNEHAGSCGYSRTFFYSLPIERRPKGVHIGTKFIITESPRDYLARIAANQNAPAAA